MHEFLNKDGDNHLIIPIGLAKLDKADKIGHTNTTNRATVIKTQRYNKTQGLGRDYELEVYKNYLPEHQD